MKFIIVSGSVVSGCGKGCAAASINLLMKMRGIKTEMIKLEPYLNLAASNLAPSEHGNVVVLDDGKECDLDLATYYALGQAELTSRNICTSGQIYKEIIEEEEEGVNLGKTIQLLPDVSNKIQEKLIDIAKDTDLVIVEIGGCIGDNESWIYFEAMRQLRNKIGTDNLIHVHVSLILYLNSIKEFKTKPLQNGINELHKFGIEPDILLCRSERPVPSNIISKISKMTGISKEDIFECPDVDNIYKIPLEFYNRNIDDIISDKIRIKRSPCRIHKYKELVERYSTPHSQQEVNIAIVGKYVNCIDAYLTLREAINHSAVTKDCKVNIVWVNSDSVEEQSKIDNFFEKVHGIICPGGFGKRATEGKIKAIKYAREKKIPFLGICLGLQCMVIEFARNVCGITNANSAEFASGTDFEPVVHFIKGQESIKKKGGTMRLGAFDCVINKGTLASNIYKRKLISERHRHRYEVNNKYLDIYAKKGLVVSGVNPDLNLVEIMEIEKNYHPFAIACQFHPEYKSKLGSSHPLFDELLEAAIKYNEVNKL